MPWVLQAPQGVCKISSVTWREWPVTGGETLERGETTEWWGEGEAGSSFAEGTDVPVLERFFYFPLS